MECCATNICEFLYSIVAGGQEYSYTMVDPQFTIHNSLCRAVSPRGHHHSQFTIHHSSYVQNGHLMMEHVVERFRDLIHEEYRKEDESFIERQGRLLFLTFLKPVTGGTGFYYVEPQTRDNRRMDLVVTYGSEEFIVELKILNSFRVFNH